MSPKSSEARQNPALASLQQEIEAYRRENPTITITEAVSYKPDPTLYLAGTLGWLKKGSTAMFMGATSQGKTVLAEQMGMELACGRDLFGLIKVYRPIRVLFLECENGLEVVARDLKSIAANLKLDVKLLRKNFRVETNHKFRGTEFYYYLQHVLNGYDAELVIIDNLQGFMEGNINDNEEFNRFINPITDLIKERGAALLLLDHTTKPSKDGTGLSDHDGAYRGAGTSRKANWARTCFDLAYIVNDGRYKVNLSKSGAWAGLLDANGKPRTHFFIQQSGKPEEPWWKLAESQAPAMKGSKSRVDLKELEEVEKEHPEYTQQDFADYFGVSRETINRTFGKRKLVLKGRKQK